MATADETKAAQAEAARKEDARSARERHTEHDKEQAKLPGSISSDDQTDKDRREGAQAGSVGEPIGNLPKKRQEKIVKQREETTKAYAKVAEDTEKLREESTKEAAQQQAKAAKEAVDEQGAWAWPVEPLPGELPPYSTARDALATEETQRKADRRSTRDHDEDDTVQVSKS
jgi:hypothetical protein